MKIKNKILILLSFLIMSFLPEDFEKQKNNKELKYLALGDSYTIGESIEEKERWSYYLVDLLRKENKFFSYPDIIAKTGWTTDELIKAIKVLNNTNKYDLVSLAIGVNNQYRGRKVEEYKNELEKLLEISIRFANNNPEHVFMLSIPDWGVTPFASNSNTKKIAGEIDIFNEMARQECKKYKINFIDITPVSRKALNNPGLIAADQLHFSGKMYKAWAEKVFENIKAIIF